MNFSFARNGGNLTRVDFSDFKWYTTSAGRMGGKPRSYLTAVTLADKDTPPPTLWATTGLVYDSFLKGHVKYEGNPERNLSKTYEKGIGIHLASREFGRFSSVLHQLLGTPEVWLPTCKVELDTNPNVKHDALVFAQFPCLCLIFHVPPIDLILLLKLLGNLGKDVLL